MNILVIFTGGTISSSVSNGYISPDGANCYRLIDEYKKYHEADSNDINFKTAKPYYILSENINGEHINKLADCMDEAISDSELDGIIVTHGTDTLQYTAAALSYIYPDLQIPVVLVSSNYILDDKRANGMANFSAAIDFITDCSKHHGNFHHGVYVAYKNENEAATIHYGTRLLPHAPYSDKIYSLDNIVYKSSLHRSSDDVSLNQTKTDACLSMHPRFTKASPVMYIRPVPGQQYSYVPDYVSAILLDSYHSGTLCTDDESFKNMLLAATKRKIPIFLTGAENRTGYESTRIYKDLSILVLPKASPVSMYMKLWLLLSSSCNQISDCMNTPICYDIM
ncbi:MAG: asparaginase domain-containing protein [Lachnospiraceae bacterium]|nr:asparaginase domain-containing protein [Lachnospiraceae bacterium]